MRLWILIGAVVFVAWWLMQRNLLKVTYDKKSGLAHIDFLGASYDLPAYAPPVSFTVGSYTLKVETLVKDKTFVQVSIVKAGKIQSIKSIQIA